MDSMPAVFGDTDENQDKWCNPPLRGRFAGWWSSKKYKDKKVMIGIAIDWPQADLPEETCGNPPKSEECVFFQDWDNTVEWDEIPSEIAEESLEALPIKPITPTPTPTRPPVLGECIFPRLITGTLTPRLEKGVIFYRVQCIIDKWKIF